MYKSIAIFLIIIFFSGFTISLQEAHTVDVFLGTYIDAVGYAIWTLVRHMSSAQGGAFKWLEWMHRVTE